MKPEAIMLRPVLFAAVLCGFCLNANADIWVWTDAKGEVHMVNSAKPLYTWLDESGKVNYSDTPDHEDAISVELVWQSTSDLENQIDETPAVAKVDRRNEFPGETEAERVAREQAEAYYCTRARDIYDSYLKAPRLYDSNDNGERVYLDEIQTAAKLAETESAVAQLCD